MHGGGAAAQGAEVIRMYQTLLGKEGFRKGIDLYFQVTIQYASQVHLHQLKLGKHFQSLQHSYCTVTLSFWMMELNNKLITNKAFVCGCLQRHDGQAVTCDDFLAAMADANGVDLSGIARWWVGCSSSKLQTMFSMNMHGSGCAATLEFAVL